MRRGVLAGFNKPQPTTHAGLWLDKFLVDNNGPAKAELVRQVAGIKVRAEYEDFFKRWEMTLAACGAQCHEAQVQECRLAVGLGSEGALETSIALHRTYGVPYIPGSALKGLAANFARHRLSDAKWQKDGEYYKTVFGDAQAAGFVTFFDALLKFNRRAREPLHADVLTTHHQEYYGAGSAAPADWDSPIPVPFLSATGQYLVALAGPEDWVKITFRILQQALREEGIGAKTSSGYGRMTLTL